MKTYKVTLLVNVSEGHPENWLPDDVNNNLQGEGEGVLAYTFEEVPEGTTLGTDATVSSKVAELV